MNTKDLREKRKKLAEDANAILAAAVKESRAATPEELEKVDKIHADIDAMKATIDRIERADDEARSFVPESQREVRVSGDDRDEAKIINAAFRSWAMQGAKGLTSDEARALQASKDLTLDANGNELRIAFRTAREALREFNARGEYRAAQTVTTSGGGYQIAREFSNELERAMLYFGGMLQVGRIIDTATGAPLDWPTMDDTGNSGRLLAINTAVTNTAYTLSTLQLDAYKYSSDSVLVPVELMQDSAFDINSLVPSMLGERIGRKLNADLTTADGSGKPNGVINAATTGKTGATGQTTSVTFDDLVDLVYSVDRAYRERGAKFMMADSTVKAIRKLKDGNGLPIWNAGSATAGEPDTLLGYPIVINNDVAAMGTSAKSIAFGDFSKYLIRRVKDVTLVRLNERYADSHQVGFLAFARFDGDLLDAGQHPVKLYVNSAS